MVNDLDVSNLKRLETKRQQPEWGDNMLSNLAYLDCSKKITTGVRYYRLELINVFSVIFKEPTHKK